MRDYRRLLEGSLFALYLARHPSHTELEAGLRSGELVEDRRIADSRVGRIPDELVDDDVIDLLRPLGEAIGRADANERRLALATSTAEHEVKVLTETIGHLEYRIAELEGLLDSANAHVDSARAEMAELRSQAADARDEAAAVRSRRSVRAVDTIAKLARRSPR
jgi:hypothetical protein